MKHIIIGGVAGGATAAARIRRNDEKAEIVLLEKGQYISYANCGLPYYIGDVITERENLFVQTPESFGKRFNIDVRVMNEAVAIHPEQKKVTIRRADGTEYTESYDKLLLSPGAKPFRPAMEGIDLEGIFTLRNVNDTDNIKNYLKTRNVKRAVVVGAGFIGLEMAENLHHAGAEVAIVEMGAHVMAPIDQSMAAHVHRELLQKGVSLHLNEAVECFRKIENGIEVQLKGGERLTTDIVILSIGVRPETSLAQQAGIKLGDAGGIWVDDHLQTSVSDIYAVGDAIEFPHPLTGSPYLNYLAGPANRQGWIAANNMVFGNTDTYEGAIATSIAKVFDLTVATTGLPAKRLKQMQIPYLSSWTHGNSHAGYYPNALSLSLKLTFSPTDGKLFGAQAVGYDGVDKRIDQIAILIKQGATIYDLTRLEHAYAPPFSSAKDPIAIAGYVAKNILEKTMPFITWRQLKDAQDAVLLDVRTAHEFAASHIDGAINIPVDDLRQRLSELPAEKNIVVYCAVGLRGYLATKILLANGFMHVRNLLGGYKNYSTATAPIIQPTNKNKVSDYREMNTHNQILKIDACGLQCPGPILKMKQAIDSLQIGERAEVTSTDAGFVCDATAWCNTTGNILIAQMSEKGKYKVIIEKGRACSMVAATPSIGKGKTFIMFSDDLDKALATFVLANGAAATGEKTTIFFTFWGLNTIKKVKKPAVQKDIFGKMFGMMLPSNSLRLALSKMNMLGIGSKMMRYLMKRKGVDSLEELRKQALKQGVEFIACQMSMDVMGVKREELLDEVTVGGVATYMERAGNANVNLFI